MTMMRMTKKDSWMIRLSWNGPQCPVLSHSGWFFSDRLNNSQSSSSSSFSTSSSSSLGKSQNWRNYGSVLTIALEKKIVCSIPCIKSGACEERHIGHLRIPAAESFSPGSIYGFFLGRMLSLGSNYYSILLGWLKGSEWLWWHFKVFRVWRVRC